MTTLALSAKSAQGRVRSISLPFINWKAIYIIGIVIALIMMVSYIFLINQLTEGVYLIKQYNNKISSLYKENDALQSEFAKANFMENVIAKTKELSFEKTKDIKYLQIIDSSLARAN